MKFIKLKVVQMKRVMRVNPQDLVAYHPLTNLDNPNHISTSVLIYLRGQGVFEVAETCEEIDAQLETLNEETP